MTSLFCGLLLGGTALAAPTLRPDVSVVGDIVTVGDMFADAGALAGQPLFRAPAPGTAGLVGLDAVRMAAARAGLSDFSASGLLEVRVERQASMVGAEEVNRLIADDLTMRGLVPPGAEVIVRFPSGAPSYAAEAVAEPARLMTLNWQPGAAAFAARLQIAGLAAPVEMRGQIELMVEAPHLAQNLRAGAVIGPADIEMKRVPLDYAAQNGVHDLSDIVGKALKRNGRVGLMLRATDLDEPMVVRRNTQVTVLLRSGPLSLTMTGQSLGDAAVGQPVAVMNPVTKKILNGVAMGADTVEVSTAAGKLQVAGL